MKTSGRCAAIVCVSLLLSYSSARGAQLSLQNYLDQVTNGNKAARGAERASEAGKETLSDSVLMTKPSLFFNFSLIDDRRPQQSSLFGDETMSRSYQLGVQQTTNFGLTGKLYYQLNEVSVYNEVGFSGFPGSTGTMYFQQPQSSTGSPAIDLTMSFWKNGFGRTTVANQESSEAGSLANQFSNRYKLKSKLLDAELAYNRLAIARQVIRIDQELVTISKKMVDWAHRRVRYNLADRADAYQVEAGLQTRELELQAAMDEERSASQNFNMTRGMDSNDVPEEVSPIQADLILKFQMPEQIAMRDDVKAAEQQQRIAISNSLVAKENTKPQLDLEAMYSYNSLDPATQDAFTDSWRFTHPYLKIGLNFSMPLDFSDVAQSQSGHEAEKVAATLNYEQTAFEATQGWKDLRTRFDEGRRRLDLSNQVVNLQKNKLDYERDRLLKGRTTAFQVLQFQQDYATAELNRLNTENQVLQIEAQMKLYKE